MAADRRAEETALINAISRLSRYFFCLSSRNRLESLSPFSAFLKFAEHVGNNLMQGNMTKSEGDKENEDSKESDKENWIALKTANCLNIRRLW